MIAIVFVTRNTPKTLFLFSHCRNGDVPIARRRKTKKKTNSSFAPVAEWLATALHNAKRWAGR